MSNDMGLKLTHNILRVEQSEELIRFYVENFGMQAKHIPTASSPDHVTILGYPINYDENFVQASSALPPATQLELHDDGSATGSAALVNSGSSKVYWKIGLTMSDVDYARRILQSKGVNVSGASQFEEIGYLCQLNDPNGFGIELLQHDFQKTFQSKANQSAAQQPKANFSLGYPVCIGQITLHSTNIDATRRFYCDLLGMKVLSIQEVSEYGFILYFFAWTNENPPKADLKDATVNREWLWKRPYTTIEIRYFHGQGRTPPFRDLQANEIGFQGIRVMCDHLNSFVTKMNREKINFKDSNGPFGKEIIIRDPDNVPIYVTQDLHAH